MHVAHGHEVDGWRYILLGNTMIILVSQHLKIMGCINHGHHAENKWRLTYNEATPFPTVGTIDGERDRREKYLGHQFDGSLGVLWNRFCCMSTSRVLAKAKAKAKDSHTSRCHKANTPHEKWVRNGIMVQARNQLVCPAIPYLKRKQVGRCVNPFTVTANIILKFRFIPSVHYPY